jgi:hypothetical protein
MHWRGECVTNELEEFEEAAHQLAEFKGAYEFVRLEGIRVFNKALLFPTKLRLKVADVTSGEGNSCVEAISRASGTAFPRGRGACSTLNETGLASSEATRICPNLTRLVLGSITFNSNGTPPSAKDSGPSR